MEWSGIMGKGVAPPVRSDAVCAQIDALCEKIRDTVSVALAEFGPTEVAESESHCGGCSKIPANVSAWRDRVMPFIHSLVEHGLTFQDQDGYRFSAADALPVCVIPILAEVAGEAATRDSILVRLDTTNWTTVLASVVEDACPIATQYVLDGLKGGSLVERRRWLAMARRDERLDRVEDFCYGMPLQGAVSGGASTLRMSNGAHSKRAIKLLLDFGADPRAGEGVEQLVLTMTSSSCSTTAICFPQLLAWRRDVAQILKSAAASLDAQGPPDPTILVVPTT
mmetsp:Transcript_34187/g.96340  ORF Transcript_34187/g.96340 Transcript_34187/m.96340 type:complete len:281 (+) Transcript_34187:111-953(+)